MSCGTTWDSVGIKKGLQIPILRPCGTVGHVGQKIQHLYMQTYIYRFTTLV